MNPVLCGESAGAQPCKAKQYSPLTLAFLGDGVYELLVREYVVRRANTQAAKLHKQAVELVCASFQSQVYEYLQGSLTTEEEEILRRGRNSSSAHSPKHAEIGDYRRATGVEALFGYLYLQGEQERIRQLFELVLQCFWETKAVQKENT